MPDELEVVWCPGHATIDWLSHCCYSIQSDEAGFCNHSWRQETQRVALLRIGNYHRLGFGGAIRGNRLDGGAGSKGTDARICIGGRVRGVEF